MRRLLFATALLTVALAPSTQARTLANPAHNIPPSRATLLACVESNSGLHNCEAHARADIDRARRREGLAPLSLPRRFAKLSGAEQLLAVADAERAARNLTPVLGLTHRLDAAAHAAAVASQDPLGPNGYSWGSNWAGGSRSALFADFVWMYDDGPGAENGDCLHAGEPGCWGHRENILARLPAPIAMGAAARGRSLAELFVGGYRPALPSGSDPLLSLIWAPSNGLRM